jgi:hypothetical protein
MPTSNVIDTSESGNWNVARPFIHYKVMQPLYLIDQYKRIARFGSVEMGDEMTFPEEVKIKARITALQRLADETYMLMCNTDFAIKKGQKPMFEILKEQAKTINKLINGTYEKTLNYATKKIGFKINENLFDAALNSLIEINTQLLDILNRADIVFTTIEDFNPDEYKDRIMNEIINSG